MHNSQFLQKRALFVLIIIFAAGALVWLSSVPGEAAGGPTPTAAVAPTPSPRPTPPPPGPDGLIAFASFIPDQQFEIFVMTSDGLYPTRLTYNSDNGSAEMPDESDFPAWSPDNTVIAFRIFSFEPNRSGLYLIDADGNNQRPIAHGYAENPTWSPDGNRIAFIAQNPTTFKRDIHIVDSDGTDEVNITNDADQEGKPDWSPDGTKIVFMRIADGTWNIFTINPDGGSLTNLTNSTTQPNWDPAWSPDSSKIAFVRGSNQIFIMNADGSNAAPIPAFGYQPTWSPDGTKIVFTVGRPDSGELWVMNADGSDQRPLTNAPAAAAFKENYAASSLAADASKQPNWQRKQPGVSVNDVRVKEGNTGTTNAVFTVSLGEASDDVVTVGYVTANGTASSASDYAAATGTLTFNPGVTSQTVVVKINGDLNVEADERFSLNLRNPTNTTITDAQGVATIANDDFAGTLQFSVSSYTVSEAAASFNVTVTRTGGSLGAVSVNYATSNGTASATKDYDSATGTFTFAPGETTPKTFAVTIKNDLLDEAAESVNLKLYGPTGGAKLGTRSTAILTINDDDASPSMTITDARMTEPDTGTRNAVFNVKLSAVSGRNVTVKYVTANGTTTPATAGTDYTAVTSLTTVTFLPGQTTRTVVIQVKADLLKEPNETFFVKLSGALYATIADAQGLGTIVNDD